MQNFIPVVTLSHNKALIQPEWQKTTTQYDNTPAAQNNYLMYMNKSAEQYSHKLSNNSVSRPHKRRINKSIFVLWAGVRLHPQVTYINETDKLAVSMNAKNFCLLPVYPIFLLYEF